MSSEADNWKWWYFVVVGVLIAGFGGYEFSSGQISKGVGSELLAVFLIVIGLFSRKAEIGKAESGKSKLKE